MTSSHHPDADGRRGDAGANNPGGSSVAAGQDGSQTATTAHEVDEGTDFHDFSFPYHALPGNTPLMGLGDHVPDFLATPGQESMPSIGGGNGSVASGPRSVNFDAADHSRRRHSYDGSDAGSDGSNQGGANAPEDNMSDEFGLSTNAPGDGPDLGGKLKDHKSDMTPAWTELKTKAGKERKRLPLACTACRRKKIRCSGEKPACKHCLRSRIPCVYKVTTRKAAPRTDYMAMLDKRLRRMEDRIIKIVPKDEKTIAASGITRAVVKPAPPGAPSASRGSKKRAADEAFGELDQWSKAPTKPTLDRDSNKHSAMQVQEREDSKLLDEGRETLPPMEMREHLAEVFFENVYGQAYHLLHKPSYMRKLRAGTLPPVLVLSVCAVSARFSSHPTFANTANFLRGEEWASCARDIVVKRYEWPNVTVLTCLLILGLHEFGTCHGGRSWSFGGQAIRMAFALQLHKDLEHDPASSSAESRLSFIDREVRRRTMWACFVMDRFNSSATDRPMFIKEQSIRVQLPIMEKLFQLDMPGPTENLNGKVPHPVPENEGQMSNARDNMGVASYMVKSIALWGRIIEFLNQGGREAETSEIWQPESEYTRLLKQAEDFTSDLPDSLRYTAENLHLHDTEGLANQFLFLHISVQQSVLFMSRFASTSSTGFSEGVPEAFLSQVGENSFKAANRISELLRDAEAHLIAAPFVGYCAFLSSTVHIFGIFSGNAAVEHASKKNLATNVKFLQKMKKYWGVFHFMSENLRELYRTNADRARKGTSGVADDDRSPSLIFQYGDWFDRYPHGVSQSDFLEAASLKRKETGADAVLEQKADTFTVEEFFTQLSPPQSAEDNTAGSGSNGAGRRNTATGANKRKASRRATATSRVDNAQLEPLQTDVEQRSMQLPLQQQQQQQQQQPPLPPQQQQGFVPGVGGHTGEFNLGCRRPSSNDLHQPGLSPQSAPGAYHALSPVSPMQTAHQFAQTIHPAAGSAAFFSPEMMGLGMMPQLDRQLVFGAYTDMDPTGIRGIEAKVDWDALVGTAGSDAKDGIDSVDGGAAAGANGEANDIVSGDLGNGFMSTGPSTAWFMPFNMEPPEFGLDPSSAISIGGGGMDGLGSVFSPDTMAAAAAQMDLDLQQQQQQQQQAPGGHHQLQE